MQLEVLEQSLTVIQSGAMRIIESAEIKLIEIERAEQALAIPQVEHQAEIRQLWEIETNDPATQEWRSMLEPNERVLVEQWDKDFGILLPEKTKTPRTLEDKLTDARLKANRSHAQRHVSRTVKTNDAR